MESTQHYAPGRGKAWLPGHASLLGSAPLRPSHVFSTRTVARPDRREAWRAAVCDTFTALTPDAPDDSPFSASIETLERGDIRISHIEACAQRVHRGLREIKTASHSHVFLNIHLDGPGRVVHDHGMADLAVGDAVLVDPHQPYVLDFDAPFRQLCVQLPDWYVRERVGAPLEALMGRPVNILRGPGHVLRAALDHLLHATPAETRLAADLFLDVTRQVLASVAPETPGNLAALARLRQYISQHYREETASPAHAAQLLGCSLRNIHKICHARGTTFGTLLREARLSAAAQQLSRDVGQARRIIDIAFSCGFGDVSNFCRVFRQFYGVSPTQYRAQRIV